ncbi:MAG: 3'-5' exonuclease [Verrucomicrobiota bacterium]
MRVLPNIAPKAEQLKIISRVRQGVEVIRGAAGSGKTTTAILRLKTLIGYFLNRRKQTGSKAPVRTLVLTYNRTLRGYISALIEKQAAQDDQVIVEVDTFAGWACDRLGKPGLISDADRVQKINELGAGLLPSGFLVAEVDYLRGRYLPDDREKYLASRREGRGASPRVDKALRERLLKEVVTPYEKWLKGTKTTDWCGLEIAMATATSDVRYDIVVADEVQDFSANQIRAIFPWLAKEHAVTFVLDGAQRIYARGFTWAEVGVNVTSANSFQLTVNYRNTQQIAAFALPFVKDLVPDDADATLPDFTQCTRTGPKPVVLRGKFSGQMAYALDFIKKHVDLKKESVAFLHPKGGGWFKAVRQGLDGAGIGYEEFTRAKDRPDGDVNVGLCTIHSAKGLEFDHVFMLGLNADILPHGKEADDNDWLQLRRLLAMGIGRAKETVHLGYKPEPNDPPWVAVMDKSTFVSKSV